MRRSGLPLAALLAGLLLSAPARAALFGSNGLDPSFCAQKQVRQTVVYIDDTLMIEGQTDWARTLDVKLRATLTPGERVSVVRLSPAAGQSGELWSGCWPAYSAAARAGLAGQTYIFAQNPLDAIGDQQKYFLHDFGAALTAIYLQAKRPAGSVQVAAADAPRKQLIRALASDEGRFASSQVTIRAIIYSDMAENSDLGSVLHPGPAPTGLAQKLGTTLRRGVFYAFGVGSDITDDPGLQETARAFWRAAFASVAASLAGLGADLNVPNILPVAAWSYPATLELDGQSLDGRLALLTDQDGTLVDSWLGITRLGIATLSGSFRCADGRRCRLEASTSAGIATSAASEQVSLTGPPGGPLVGRLGVRAQGMSFPIRAGEPE